MRRGLPGRLARAAALSGRGGGRQLTAAARGARRVTGAEPRALLLAAGGSTRYGGDKLLAPLPGGRAVILAAAENLLAAGLRPLVVIRAGSSPLADALGARGDLDLLECPEASDGMARSLAWGVRATLDAPSWLVALGDMPFLSSTVIRQVADRLAAGAELVAPVFRGRQGHPVGFARRWSPALLALRGDRGARDILQAHRDRLELIEVADDGILRDVDRPGDRAR